MDRFPQAPNNPTGSRGTAVPLPLEAQTSGGADLWRRRPLEAQTSGGADLRRRRPQGLNEMNSYLDVGHSRIALIKSSSYTAKGARYRGATLTPRVAMSFA